MSSESDRKEEPDRVSVSELPDCVLLHIMNFMKTKDAVHTRILSKSWKDIWKSLTNLSFCSSIFKKLTNFNDFVLWVLSNRDHSISLLNLNFVCHGFTKPNVLNRVMEYAALHNVQHLSINTYLEFRPRFAFSSSIFSCSSLISLEISIFNHDSTIKTPELLHLPELKTLHLIGVTFTPCDKVIAEPFSTCFKLKSLVLSHCSLHKNADVLFVSNSSLSTLFIEVAHDVGFYKIGLYTPNLSSLTILDWFICQIYPICDLPFLEEADIHSGFTIYTRLVHSNLINLSWLQLLANVKILTLSKGTIETILDDLSDFGSMEIQPPCFVRLESLRIDMFSERSEEEGNRVVAYLLKNSPPRRVDIIYS